MFFLLETNIKNFLRTFFIIHGVLNQDPDSAGIPHMIPSVHLDQINKIKVGKHAEDNLIVDLNFNYNTLEKSIFEDEIQSDFGLKAYNKYGSMKVLTF